MSRQSLALDDLLSEALQRPEVVDAFAASIVKRLPEIAAHMAAQNSQRLSMTKAVVVAAANMAKAAPLIEAAIVEHGIGLVIVDPIGAWFEEDSKSDHAVRTVIDPLANVARRTRCGVLFVAHLRKAPAEDAMDAFAGSHQMTAAVRVAISMEAINETERSWRVAKSNFERPEAGMVWRLLKLDTEVPTVVWRKEGQADQAALALKAAKKAPMIDPATVLPHLRASHEPLPT